MDSDCQMFLVINGDRHRLKQGITLLGTSENDRYSVIRLNEKSFCAKHAAVRCNPTTQELHIMDLCSHSGTTLTVSAATTTPATELPPLEWHPVPDGGRITLGTVLECRVEISTAAGAGGDANRRSSRLASASFFEDSADFIDCSLEEPPLLKSRQISIAGETSLQRDSFVVPATQPPAKESTSMQVNDVAAAVGDDLDDDDLFYIPETQEPAGTNDESQVIEPIGNTIGSGDKEEDFLCFESQDERNTGDGLFNNPYVELQSQNLLQNLDESYKRVEERKSIAPDCSVDSISFRGGGGKAAVEDTDEDLSKLEWNETKNTSKAASVGQDREGSVTPELVFGKDQRVESVTPDLDFDRITPQQEPVKQASTSKLSLSKKVEEVQEQDRTESVTPDLDFEKRKDDDDEEGILPNQEAFNRSEMDPYELATQVMVPEDKDEDPYLMATQAMPVERESPSKSVYDLATQAEPNKSAFKVPALPEPDAYDLATQQMPQEKVVKARSLRKVNVKLTDWGASRSPDVSLRANKEFELGVFDVATQKLPGNDDADDAYDLATQALPRSNVQPEEDHDDTEDEENNDTIPLNTMAYDLQTQPLVAKDSRGSLVDEEDAEMTHNFRPPVNSTCRPSMIAPQIEDKDDEQELNISPSSNKENRTEVNKAGKKSSRAVKRLASTQETEDLLGFTEPTEEDLDDDYCLAETMPVVEPDQSKKSKTGSVFKVPENRSTTSSSKSSRTISSMETPSRSKPSSLTGDTDTCSFEFNTPEHPFLNMAKKETILAVSDLIKSQQPKPLDRLARKNKYIFGDSSDEDQDPNEPIFKKQDSKIQIMKYDRDEPKPEQPSTSVASERRSTRDKKKNQRYSLGDEDDDNSSKASTSTSSSKSKSSTRNATKKKVIDQSVDYQPSASITAAVANETTKSTRSRKRKAIEEQLPAPQLPAPTEPEPAKKRGRSKRTAAEELPPPPPPPPKAEKRTKQTRKQQSEASEDEESSEAANTSTGSGSESASSGTRKSSRSASKPRLMFTKMSPEPYKRMVTRAGGTIVDLPEQASILVSDRVYRTYKFLCAIARGIPIVGQPYLEEVQKRRELIDPWDYILEDAEMERRFKFSLKKSLKLAKEAKIFQDYSVFVTASTKPPPEELQLIVASAGGRVLKFPAQQPKHADKVFVVSNVEDKDLWPKFRERFPAIDIISTEGFMLSVMQHYKNFRSYRMT